MSPSQRGKSQSYNRLRFLTSRISVVHDQVYAGRPVRRLVSFFDSVRDLVEERDRRLMLELDLLEGNAGENDMLQEDQHTIECV
jgi:hypothetical protein